MATKFQERAYQKKAANKLFEALKSDPQCNPIVVIPTAGGKSIVLCDVIDKILSDNPQENVLVLSHDSRILKQNHSKFEDYFEIDIGLYSSGLKSKTILKITVAGIQSVHRNAELFKRFGKILVDECHLITIRQNGMYEKFFAALDNHQIAGVTATPFRTNYGYIYEGEHALFNKNVYDLSETKRFNKLVKQGYLSKLLAKPTALKLDTTKIKKVAGDFSKKDLSISLDRAHITEAAILEAIHFGEKYKKWLCFAIDIQHAEHIKERLTAHGLATGIVHSQMKDQEVDKVLRDFSSGILRVVINVNMLSVGYDEPEIDLIILLRPTLSPVFHCQSIGRGLRVVYADGYPIETAKQRLEAISKGPKQHCLVLDFAGNVERLGPINQMDIQQKQKKKGTGEAIVRACPDCGIYQHVAIKVCENCGFEFPIEEKIKAIADKKEIVSKRYAPKIKTNKRKWYKVDAVSYSIASNYKRPDSLQVVYVCGSSKVSEQIRFLENGYARAKALNWIRFRWNEKNGALPISTFGVYKNCRFLPTVKKIEVDTRGGRPQITNVKFKNWPED